MRGKCWDMAVALHRVTKLPIQGLYDAEGTCHHAFVLTQDGQGLDARGLQPIEKLKEGCAGQEVRSMDLADIARWVGRGLTPAEVNAARRVILADSRLRATVQQVALPAKA